MNLLEQLTEEVKIEDQYQIFQDMDGCLSDFEERFEHYSGLSCDEYMKQATTQYGEKKALEKFWELIHIPGIRFWRGMSWMKDGKELWNFIKQYKPILLTAPSRNKVSREGKQLWVDDNISGTPIEFRFAEQKKELATPTNILIDDLQKNIDGWKSAGGIGILHTSSQNTIKELQKMGFK